MTRACIALLILTAPALAQTDIDPDHKHAWGDNIGWLNFADADDGAQGVQVESTFLAGFIWGENVGWISVGDGAPGGGFEYTNDDGADHGVNIDGSGNLYGYAWGENIGWINFDTLDALGPYNQHARFDGTRFRGYAWGENVGWINLDDAEHFVAIGGGCDADCNDDGALNILDFVCFQAEWQAQSPAGDCDANGTFNILDFVCYQNAFVNGCP